MKKSSLFLMMILSVCSVCSAQQQKPDYIHDDAYILRQAQDAYDRADYGAAMKHAEEARIYRRSRIAWEKNTLLNAFKPHEVQKVGDDMSAIITKLKERQDYDALEIIDRYQRREATAKYCRSAKTIIDFLNQAGAFPEADYITGSVYQLEGEFDLAEHYLENAWKYREALDIPALQIDILYKLADIAHGKGDTIKYEEYLTAVVCNDSGFKNETLKKGMYMIMNSGKKGCTTEFFNMFRNKDYRSIAAYRMLADVYEAQNDNDRALSITALGVVTGFTRMYEVMAERDPEFSYTGLSGFIEELQKFKDVQKWAADNCIWESFVQLERRSDTVYPFFSAELRDILKDTIPDEYWRKQAELVHQSDAD